MTYTGWQATVTDAPAKGTISTSTVHWTGALRAVSSISHSGDTRGTITMLRREQIVTPDGQLILVPIISGNSLRGRLRRHAEELLRDVLEYEGHLRLPIAHALRSGGALAKTSGESLSGKRLATLRHLVPLIGVFGCAGGGRIIDGCLQVGKVVPHFNETRHLLENDATDTLPAFRATQIETYTRHDDSDRHDFVTTVAVDERGYPVDDITDTAPGSSMLMLYRLETFPAGTRFSTWLRLNRATPLEVSFFEDVLAHYTQFSLLGGRIGRGHGRVIVDFTRHIVDGVTTSADWVSHVRDNRAEALQALTFLT